MSKILVCGDSITSGLGVDPDDLELNNKSWDHLWTNVVINDIEKLKDHEIINLSKPGYSNQEMLNQVLWYIGKEKDVKYIIVGWVDLIRFNYEIGFELYDTLAGFRRDRTHVLNDITYTESFLRKKHQDVMALIHQQSEIVKFIQQINLLLDIAETMNIIVVNVNINCPWDVNFFDRKTGKFNIESMTSVTKYLLNVDNRLDQEIYELYDKQHDQYEKWGGIRPESWANLYDPLCKNMLEIASFIDLAADNRHPGEKTHREFAEKIKKYFNKIISH